MEEYYDLDSHRVFVGIKDLNAINSNMDGIYKQLLYPSVLKKLYIINQYGIVINLASNYILQPSLDDHGYPSVILSIKKDDKFTMCKFRIVDLVACSFIRNSEYYLERGYIASNKNGIITDNYYKNIVYKEK